MLPNLGEKKGSRGIFCVLDGLQDGSRAARSGGLAMLAERPAGSGAAGLAQPEGPRPSVARDIL